MKSIERRLAALEAYVPNAKLPEIEGYVLIGRGLYVPPTPTTTEGIAAWEREAMRSQAELTTGDLAEALQDRRTAR